MVLVDNSQFCLNIAVEERFIHSQLACKIENNLKVGTAFTARRDHFFSTECGPEQQHYFQTRFLGPSRSRRQCLLAEGYQHTLM